MRRWVLCLLIGLLGAVSAPGADDTIRAVQTRLKAGGFYSGEINGRYDSKTAAGVTRYQIRNGLQINGKLDQATRYALGVNTTEPRTPLPRFGEDVWRYLRKSDQAALSKLIDAETSKQSGPPKSSTAIKNVAPAPPAAPPPGPSAAPVQPNGDFSSDRLKDYIAAFVLAGLDPQVGAETEFFADRVRYFGEKGVTREKIRRDLQHYNERWPRRGFWLAGPLDVEPGQGQVTVTFPLRYELENGKKRAAGTVRKTLVLEKTGSGDLQIVAVNERKAP